MVQELDLTDQDVSTIAELIDSEIQSHIPDWTPTDISGDNIDGDVSTSNSPVSDSDAPPLINEFSSLALERLPSGRKYWSDSPKAGNGNSPVKQGISNLNSQEDSVDTRDTDDNEKSPGSQEQSPRNQDDPNVAENCGSLSGDSLDASIDLHNTNGAHLFEPEEVKIIVENLDNLLAQQRKELDELKRKHELEIADVLQELPPAFCQKVLDNYKLKIPDCILHHEAHC